MDRLKSLTMAVGLALLAGSCGPPPPLGPAWDRWGIRTTGGEQEAEEQFAHAYDRLYGRSFPEALMAYDELVRRFPRSAEAHHGRSMILRYQGGSALDSAMVECEKSLRLDKMGVASRLNYADLLVPFRGVKLGKGWTSEKRIDRALEVYRQAASADHPLAAYAQVGLWNLYMGRGDLANARRAVLELGRVGYFPPALREFGRNLLVALEPDAILFTNGDNDTHPLLAMQLADGLRPDVSVVNLSLLNTRELVKSWRDEDGLPVSWSDEQLDRFEVRFDSALGKPQLLSEALAADIADRTEEHGRPVYFAVTVFDNYLRPYQERDRAVLEGLVWRIAADSTRDTIDYRRLVENAEKTYRYAAMVGDSSAWPGNLSPVTRHVTGLAANYVTIYQLLARRYRSRGRRESAVDCYERAHRFLQLTGEWRFRLELLDEWLDLAPDDTRAQGFRQELWDQLEAPPTDLPQEGVDSLEIQPPTPRA